MCVTAAAAIISAGTQIAGSVMGYQSQKTQAYQQWLYNAQTTRINEEHRAELIKYQNTVYDQEIDYKGEVLGWQKSEFARQGKMVDNAVKSIEANRFTQYATLLQRQVEEQIAAAFNIDTVERQARKMRASAQVAADSRGVEGPSIEQIINDVSRQEGDAITVLELNRSATMRQLNLEMMGLKASADQALYNIPIQTYGPLDPVQTPAPVPQVQPTAPVPMPSRGAMVTNVVGGVLQGMQNYASWSGQSFRQAFKIG